MAKKLVNLWVTGPIDWWSGMIDLRRHSAGEFAQGYGDPSAFTARVDNLFEAAKRLAAENGWEGDISQGPFLSALPSAEGETDLIIAWKQPNNGTTFVASDKLLSGLGFDQKIPYQASY